MARKAALYLRSSKDRHDVSVDSQNRELKACAKKAGHIVIAEFCDKMESAKTDDRPAFQSMIDEVRSKNCRFDLLYCYDTSRFSRRQYHAQIYKQLLKRKGIELIFLKLPKTDTILDPIIESLMEAFDEFHSQKSKMDGLRGMRENIEQGWRAGGKAIHGYNLHKEIMGTKDGQPLTKSKLVPDPRTFSDIQTYMKGRARGESRRALSDRIKSKIPYSTLVYLEDSALTYAGHTVWNRHRELVDGAYVGAGKGRYRDRSEWVIKHCTHEPMITDQEAEAIFRNRDAQKLKVSRYRRNNYLMSCLMRCNCGAKVDGDGGYYRCHDRCGVKSIKKETLEHALIDTLFDQFFNEESFLLLQQEIEELFIEQQPKLTYLVDQIGRELRKTEKQITDLTGLLTEIKHQRPLLERIDSLEETRQDLELKLNDAKEVVKPQVLDMTPAELREFAEQWRTDLTSGTMEKRKAIFRQLVEEATFDGNELHVTPSYHAITGVNVASPRGFEPLLPG